MRHDDNRLDKVFQCIVESYIDTAVPVGSRMVSKRYGGHLSPASIRNVMADLEEMGLIHQPHTSAGRVPTDRGYRYYVDSLMGTKAARRDMELPNLDRLLGHSQDLEEAAEKVSRILASLTRNAGFLLLKEIRRVAYLAELEESVAQHTPQPGARQFLYVDGASNILEQPEFSNLERIQALMRAFELKESLARFLQREIGSELRIYIGNEVECEDLKNVSIVVKRYSRRGVPVGDLGVIGPTRMNYDETCAIVERMADSMTEYLEEL